MVPIRDPAEARKWFARFLERDWPALLGAPPDVRTSDPHIREVCDHYLNVYLPTKNAARKTLIAAAQICYQFERFASSRHVGRVSQLSPALVDAYAASLRDSELAPKTIRNHLIMLRACLNAAVDRGLLDKSPIKRWLLPKVADPEIQPLTADQLREVLAIIHENAPALAPIVTWIAMTGNRPSDACEASWANVDVSNAIVIRTQVKVKQLAQYEISAELLAILKIERSRPCYKADGPVFRDQFGDPFTVNKLYHDFTRAMARASFERHITLKDLRHTFGSLMANEMKCPLPIVQRLMGHKSITTTMQYIKPSAGAEYVHAFSTSITEQIGISKAPKPRKPRK
jgi:integrase